MLHQGGFTLMRFFSFPRTYKLAVQVGSDLLGLDVKFHRSNSYIDIDLDNRAIKEVTGRFVFRKYDNVNDSIFVAQNLLLDSVESQHLKITNQFKHIRNKQCLLFSNETITLGKTKTPNGDFLQKVQLYMFLREHDLYVHCERHFIDATSQKKVVKSVGAEIEFEKFKI